MQIEDKELQERTKNQVIYALRRLEDGSEYVNVDQLVKTFEGLYSTIEGLKGEVEVLNDALASDGDLLLKMHKNNNSLRQQVETYRTALEEIAQGGERDYRGQVLTFTSSECRCIARKALEVSHETP